LVPVTFHVKLVTGICVADDALKVQNAQRKIEMVQKGKKYEVQIVQK
jgi:hypothetical protein